MTSFSFSHQYDAMQCGVACLQMIGHYYGREKSIIGKKINRPIIITFLPFSVDNSTKLCIFAKETEKKRKNGRLSDAPYHHRLYKEFMQLRLS